jgi:hypothetical protein
MAMEYSLSLPPKIWGVRPVASAQYSGAAFSWLVKHLDALDIRKRQPFDRHRRLLMMKACAQAPRAKASTKIRPFLGIESSASLHLLATAFGATLTCPRTHRISGYRGAADEICSPRVLSL